MQSSAPFKPALAVRSFGLLLLLACTNMADAVPSHGESHSHYLLKRLPTYAGCFSSTQPFTNVNTYKYQTTGWCGGICAKSNSQVMGFTNGQTCWCANDLPAASAKVEDSKCNTPCAGYGTVTCGGGNNFMSVWIMDGVDPEKIDNFSGNAASSGSSSSSSSSSGDSSPTTAAPSVITSLAPGRTVVVTLPPAESATSTLNPDSKSSGGSSNTAGIAAGVVVGVIALCALIGVATFFILRQRKRKQAEEEYRQRSQVDFMRTVERRGSGGFSSVSDSRLDPATGGRNSVGSLADNHDYSRRILRVANPDSS